MPSRLSWPSSLTKTVDVGPKLSLSVNPSCGRLRPTQFSETMTRPFCFHSVKWDSCWDRFATSQPLLDALIMTLAPESINPFSVDDRNEIALFPESCRIRYRCPGLTRVSGTSCPDENIAEPSGQSCVTDIRKHKTEPVMSAISHRYGTNTGSTGGCVPSVNTNVTSELQR